MLISHMSEDDEINFYPPVAGGSVIKGLRNTPDHPDMVLKGFYKFTQLPGSKNGKNRTFYFFDILLNPFITEPLAVFSLLVNDNLGVINQKIIINSVIIMKIALLYQTNSHIYVFKFDT